ncbi:hypothetical protein B1757_01865 [Acidithiobacillus marinus]|uniref:Uncharacterized protein n=1 Tax=Acidithiobacillus marinus TaxID=187490 RepID=A0A2I1DQF9_9PROT|nr:hypothetical protein [Acidithiobacillus marinus]PKY12110.1 hypothetical protein B1757_01865 [Acidithiobacillus marinus]
MRGIRKLYGITRLNSIGVIYRETRKFIANKDNSFVFSMIAIILSVVSIVYSIYQGNVDISHERYELWTHVNSSLERQEDLDLEIYPLLFNRIVQSKAVLLGIHGDELKCSYLVNLRRNNLSLKRMLYYNVKNASLVRLENSEQYGLQDVILENGSLADALSVNGWIRFLKADNYSNKWWTSLSWDTMQLGFFPRQWAYKCTGTRPGKKKVVKIKISSQSLRKFKADLQAAILDDTYIQDRLTPNVAALKNLEAENMPSPHEEYGSLGSVFGPLNKGNAKNDSPLKIMNYATSVLNDILASVYAKEAVATGQR